MKPVVLNRTHTPNLNQVGRRLRRSRPFVNFCVFCGKALPLKFQVSNFQFLIAVLCAVVPLCLCPLSYASGITSLHSLESGSISITNTQKNSSWVPVALLFRFDAPASGTIIVERNTGSTTFQLTTIELSDNLYAVWIPEAPISFNLNDVLLIYTPATAGSVEIIRKGE